MIRTIIILSSLILILSIPLRAERIRIAIMDFEAQDIAKNDAVKVSELIRNEMINIGKFVIIERSQMGMILKEQGVQQTGCTDISCAVEIGKVLSAKKILVGTVMKLGDSLIITGRIVDVEKGVAEFSEKEVARDKNDLYRAVGDFAEKLSKRIKYRSEEGTAGKKTEEPVTVSKHSYSNPYTWPTVGLLALTGATLGSGLYFNADINTLNSDYKKLIDDYNSATDSSATSIHNKMDSVQDDIKSSRKLRGLSYILSGASAIATGFFAYKFFTYTPPAETAVNRNYRETFVLPYFYTSNNIFSPSAAYGFSFGGGVIYKF